MSRLVARSARIVVDRQTDRQTDTQNDYCNPRCACARRGLIMKGNWQPRQLLLFIMSVLVCIIILCELQIIKYYRQSNTASINKSIYNNNNKFAGIVSPANICMPKCYYSLPLNIYYGLYNADDCNNALNKCKVKFCIALYRFTVLVLSHSLVSNLHTHSRSARWARFRTASEHYSSS